RVGIAKYLVPLAFAYNPSLLLVGPTWLSIVSTAVALVGLYVLSTGLEGWYRGRLNPLQRFAAIVAAGLTLMPPTELIGGVQGYLWWIAGLVLTGIVLGPRLMAKSTSQSSSLGDGAGSETVATGTADGEAR
ncbi:MAG: hypothetical protein AAF346_12525, partial [Pseudomonadota bacterium]